MKGTRIYQGYYTLGDSIASGGFATIYEANITELNRRVAIKIAKTGGDKGLNASVYKEAEILAKFHHEGIVRLFEIPPMLGKTDTRTWANAATIKGHPAFFVMELLSGGTLQNYMDHVKKISGEEASAIGLKVARALDHVHRKSFAHNDLKLENIVFRAPVAANTPFDPVLIDFGIATRVKMQTGQGTLYIMSPEQLELADDAVPPEVRDEQEALLDKTKVDVWGLGVVLYYLVTGKLPFAGRTAKGITSRIKHSDPEGIINQGNKQITPYLEELILEGCLAKNPRYRLELIELGQALKRFGQDVTAAKAGPTKRKGLFGR